MFTSKRDSMKILVFLIAIFTGLLLNSPKSYADGNELLRKCNDAKMFLDTNKFETPLEALNTGICFGTVQGVRNTMQIMQNYDGRGMACIPESVTNGQAVRIVTNYLNNNPESLHDGEVSLVMVAYMKAFPCK